MDFFFVRSNFLSPCCHGPHGTTSLAGAIFAFRISFFYMVCPCNHSADSCSEGPSQPMPFPTSSRFYKII